MRCMLKQRDDAQLSHDDLIYAVECDAEVY